MPKAGGVSIYTCDGVETLVNTKTCVHCSSIIDIPVMRKFTDHADFCRLCYAVICANCAGKPCAPRMKAIEAQEKAFYKRQQFARSMGF